MKYKLIALDMDATLLNKEKIITPKTEKALIEAQKAGVRVAIASGRMPLGVKKYAKQLQLEKYGGYCICFNGGLITAPTGEIIHQQFLDKKYLKIACEMVKKTDITVVVHRHDGLFGNKNTNKFTEIAPKTVNAPLTQFENLPDSVNWDIYKILFVGELKKLEDLQEKLTEKYSDELEIVFSSPWFLEAMPKGTDKGTALKNLCEKIGTDISETIACGDNFNDYTMLKTAGLGVAMANAVEELKDIADYVTVADCDNDGIAEVINRFILL